MSGSLLQLLLGLLILGLGADVLVRGASGLAIRMGISTLVVGLTVVAFGTSSPELVVGVKDSLGGQGQIALGTVIGSNICNIVLILGVASLVRPLVVRLQVLKTDLPVLVAVTFLVAGFVLYGSVPRWAGGLFLIGIVTYAAVTIHLARREQESDVVHEEYGTVVDESPPALPILLGLVAAGSMMLVFGSDLMLKGAVTIAQEWGVSEAVIGLTLVAVGGSLPELATSVVAALKGNGDIAVGNVIGSNIFNLLCVLGFSAVASPLVVTDISVVDLAMMVSVTVLVIPLMYTDFKISRVEGACMLIAYVCYVGYLFSYR